MKTAQIVGLCALCSVVSGGVVAMLGAGQPQPMDETQLAASFGVATEAKSFATPILAGAPKDGFVVVATSMGDIYCIAQDGYVTPAFVNRGTKEAPELVQLNAYIGINGKAYRIPGPKK